MLLGCVCSNLITSALFWLLFFILTILHCCGCGISGVCLPGMLGFGCYLVWWFSQVLQAGVFTSNAGSGSNFKILRGLSLPNINRQEGGCKIYS